MDIFSHELFNQSSPRLLKEFQVFHRENPHVYEQFKKLTHQMARTGRKKYSSELIINVIRWHIDLDTRSTDEFKINNNFKSFYSRLFVAQNPEFRSFFEFRSKNKKEI